MANELAAFSNELAALVERAAQSVVAVHARPRFSSSGVFWRPGIIVTAEHTSAREEITVTLPDGSTSAATLAGRDAGTDLAVLRVEATRPRPWSRQRRAGGRQRGLDDGPLADSGPNATMGIVSAVSGEWRTWRGGRLDHYIRLDLTLYPGSRAAWSTNSMATRSASPPRPSRAWRDWRFPHPPSIACSTVLARGHVARGYLGLGLQPVELPDHQKGLIVVSLEPEDRRPRPARSSATFCSRLAAGRCGHRRPQGVRNRTRRTVVRAGVLRGGESRELEIIVGERPRRS